MSVNWSTVLFLFFLLLPHPCQRWLWFSLSCTFHCMGIIVRVTLHVGCGGYLFYRCCCCCCHCCQCWWRCKMKFKMYTIISCFFVWNLFRCAPPICERPGQMCCLVLWFHLLLPAICILHFLPSAYSTININSESVTPLYAICLLQNFIRPQGPSFISEEFNGWLWLHVNL